MALTELAKPSVLAVAGFSGDHIFSGRFLSTHCRFLDLTWQGLEAGLAKYASISGRVEVYPVPSLRAEFAVRCIPVDFAAIVCVTDVKGSSGIAVKILKLELTRDIGNAVLLTKKVSRRPCRHIKVMHRHAVKIKTALGILYLDDRLTIGNVAPLPSRSDDGCVRGVSDSDPAAVGAVTCRFKRAAEH